MSSWKVDWRHNSLIQFAFELWMRRPAPHMGAACNFAESQEINLATPITQLTGQGRVGRGGRRLKEDHSTLGD